MPSRSPQNLIADLSKSQLLHSVNRFLSTEKSLDLFLINILINSQICRGQQRDTRGAEIQHQV